MKNWTTILSIVVLTLTILILSTDPVAAQCPMCRATAETNLANGGTEGQGLNNGILYMLTLPYIIVGTIGYIWYRNRRREEPEADELV